MKGAVQAAKLIVVLNSGVYLYSSLTRGISWSGEGFAVAHDINYIPFLSGAVSRVDHASKVRSS